MNFKTTLSDESHRPCRATLGQVLDAQDDGNAWNAWSAALTRCDQKHATPALEAVVGEDNAREVESLGAQEERGDYCLAADSADELLEWIEALAAGMATGKPA